MICFLTGVTDAVILGTCVDGVLLVNSPGRIRCSGARQEAEKFRRMQAGLLGMVLNRLSRRRDGYYDHYYYCQSDDGQSEKSRRWLSWLRRRLRPDEESGE